MNTNHFLLQLITLSLSVSLFLLLRGLTFTQSLEWLRINLFIMIINREYIHSYKCPYFYYDWAMFGFIIRSKLLHRDINCYHPQPPTNSSTCNRYSRRYLDRTCINDGIIECFLHLHTCLNKYSSCQDSHSWKQFITALRPVNWAKASSLPFESNNQADIERK